MADKVSNIQVLRAFAAANVVLFHTISHAAKYGHPSQYLSWMGDWGAGGVDLFFVISGFVIVTSQLQNPKSAGTFVAKRLRRIIPLYWFLTTVWIAFKLVLPSAFGSPASLTSMLLSYGFVSQLLRGAPAIVVGWTLEYEMLFYLVFGAMLLTRNCILGIVGTALLLGLFVAFGWSDPVVLEFILGMGAGYVCSKAKVGFGWLILGVGIAALLADLWLVFDATRVVKWGIPSLLIVVGAASIPQTKNRMLPFLGDASYSIYLIQMFTIPAFYKLASAIRTGIPNELQLVACVCFTIAAGAVVYLTIERPLLRWLHHRQRPAVDLALQKIPLAE